MAIWTDAWSLALMILLVAEHFLGMYNSTWGERRGEGKKRHVSILVQRWLICSVEKQEQEQSKSILEAWAVSGACLCTPYAMFHLGDWSYRWKGAAGVQVPHGRRRSPCGSPSTSQRRAHIPAVVHKLGVLWGQGLISQVHIPDVLSIWRAVRAPHGSFGDPAIFRSCWNSLPRVSFGSWPYCSVSGADTY